ncbi:MAG: photosynthetic reaction center cytochrome c subunit family protein, partial [Vicinamibacteria bacterium]
SLDSMDFGSDDKEPKRVARRMLAMVAAINQEHLTGIGRQRPLSVGCFTCHRGVARPEPLESIIGNVLETSGIDAAISRYRELRKEHYGSSSYDFGETALNRLGEEALRAGKTREALAIFELNVEFHPDSAWLLQLLGEAYLASGDRDRARASFERSLEIFPDNAAARKRLEELEK